MDGLETNCQTGKPVPARQRTISHFEVGIFAQVFMLADQPNQNLPTASAVLPRELPSMANLSDLGVDDYIFRTRRAV